MSEIKYEDRKAIYEKAIDLFGVLAQTWMVVEEMSELTKALCKIQRGQGGIEELADEIADVTIMLEQLSLMYDLGDVVGQHMDYKVSRLRRMIERKEKGRTDDD